MKKLTLSIFLFVCCARGCDPYFENSLWYHELEKQLPIALFPREILCSLRPPKQNTKFDVLVSLVVWEGIDHVTDLIENVVHFTTSASGIVLHVNQHIGGWSVGEPRHPDMEAEFLSTITSRVRNILTPLNNDRFILNPYRIEVEATTGTILLAHLTNYAAAAAVGWKPAYFMMVASNSRFIRCGIESHIAATKLSFGFNELCHFRKKYKIMKGHRADTTLEQYGTLAQGTPNNNQCWHLCSNFGRSNGIQSIVYLLKLVFCYDDDDESNAAWMNSVLKKFGFAVQRHEGAFFPHPVIKSLMDFLIGSSLNIKLTDLGRPIVKPNLTRENSTETVSKGGLFILADAQLPVEEVLLSTWLVHVFPQYIPHDHVERDIPTYFISGGHSIKASQKNLREAIDRGYFLLKRVNPGFVHLSPKDSCNYAQNKTRFVSDHQRVAMLRHNTITSLDHGLGNITVNHQSFCNKWSFLRD